MLGAAFGSAGGQARALITRSLRHDLILVSSLTALASAALAAAANRLGRPAHLAERFCVEAWRDRLGLRDPLRDS